jgi:hypothetical protein
MLNSRRNWLKVIGGALLGLPFAKSAKAKPTMLGEADILKRCEDIRKAGTFTIRDVYCIQQWTLFGGDRYICWSTFKTENDQLRGTLVVCDDSHTFTMQAMSSDYGVTFLTDE